MARRSSATGRLPAAVLAIGGSDPTAGAGVEADVRTLEAHGVSPAVAVTAVAVQDAVRVRRVAPLAARLVAAQIDAAFDALPVAVVKCGMLARPAIVEAVASAVRRRGVRLVLDPVLRASGGETLGNRALSRALAERLLPLAAVVTPNLYEARVLTGMAVDDVDSMERAARSLLALGARAVVLKGGHLAGEPVDVLAYGRRMVRLAGARIARDMHGTGCAFASALAANLARGMALERSVRLARKHVRTLLNGALRLPNGAFLRSPRR